MRAIVELEDAEHDFRPPYSKFKLDLACNDHSPAFNVYAKNDGVRTEVALNSFAEALQHIRYTTKHSIAISFSKLYAHEDEIRKREEEVQHRLEGDSDSVLEQERPEIKSVVRIIRLPSFITVFVNASHTFM